MAFFKVAIVIFMVWCLAPVSFGALWHSGEVLQYSALKRIQEAENGVMNYFIAGYNQEASTAFSFLNQKCWFRVPNAGDMAQGYHVEFLPFGVRNAPRFNMEGITCLRYSPLGANPQAMFDQMLMDMREGNYRKVRVFGLSTGCQVVFMLNLAEEMIRQEFPQTTLECFEVNPCVAPQALQPDCLRKFRARMVPATLILLVLGWLAYVPCIRPDGGAYCSYRLLYDQLMTMVHDQRYRTDRGIKTLSSLYLEIKKPFTQAVVISLDDQLLDNVVIVCSYDDAKILKVETQHADTLRVPDAYAAVLKTCG